MCIERAGERKTQTSMWAMTMRLEKRETVRIRVQLKSFEKFIESLLSNLQMSYAYIDAIKNFILYHFTRTWTTCSVSNWQESFQDPLVYRTPNDFWNQSNCQIKASICPAGVVNFTHLQRTLSGNKHLLVFASRFEFFGLFRSWTRFETFQKCKVRSLATHGIFDPANF